ncbi:MFS transporter [Streptomyces sp. NPDC047117]|uniref:MFS transporter n=1 Tax=Streptomyces sp. NPDC047117 TaxID=3155379 RepID=UPI0033DDD932
MTTTQTASTGSPAEAPSARPGVATARLVALAMGFVMATLDATVVNVAGVSIKDRLDASLSQLAWVVDGYVLTFAAFLLLGGSLANRVGAKKAYSWGMGLFVLASLACGLAPSAEVLIAARLLQGVGAALFMPSSLTLLVLSFPDKAERARMLGIWTAIVSTATGLGPVVGGVMVELLGWRSIFLLNLPLGLIGLVLTARLIPAPDPAPGTSAVTGHLLSFATLAAACFALIEGGSYGWTSAVILAAGAAAVLCGALFVVHERRAGTPVIPRALYGDPRFSAANAIGFLLNVGLFGGSFMLSLYLQQGRGASPFAAGLQLLPVMAVILVGNLTFSRLSQKYTARSLLLAGFSVAAVCALALVTVSAAMPYWLLAGLMVIANFCVGMIVPALTASMMEAAGAQQANIAGAALNANRQIGALVGIALMAVLLGGFDSVHRGAAASFLVIGLAYALSALLTWRFVRTPAEPAA